ncbi:hypothetical protein K491DRAFT_722946 [Lophiostoma macrostomum CBS 122681]|uniref:F-box domain-containing protein n=1 Tax=Lophiostoma macrostomum CBS 122681 TaxID=1314788 RepID=A0A6A6SLX5_9PLEO|nr:hypothetical protein K491DRAFT_722946 [Lophiostoma macrostomum CBS 122681]
MTLTSLPNELLDIVVRYSLPQSFENFAMTCRLVYYDYYPHDGLVAASDLIALIAVEPIIARYIHVADLQADSRFLRHARARGQPPKSVPSIENGGAIVELFANSAILRRARLDWRKFYSTFAEDVREARYSQNGSAFLLTLLEDAESLTLPFQWKQNATTHRLLNALSIEAKQPNPLSSGLRSANHLEASTSRLDSESWGLRWAGPFLNLPHLKTFRSRGCLAVGQNLRSLTFRGSPYMAETLEEAYLRACCIDAVGITDFLKHTPRLKTLRYSHSTKHGYCPLDWDICKFVNAIGHEAGSHLLELQVDIGEVRGSILPGKVSMQWFKKLQKLCCPLELVMCNVDAAGVTGMIANSFQRMFNGS